MEKKKTKNISNGKLDKKNVVKKTKNNTKQDSPGRVLNFMSDFTQALLITAVIVLLTISFIVVGNQKKLIQYSKKSSNNYFDVLEDVKIVKKGKAFFGDLYLSSQSSRNAAGYGEASSSSVSSDGITVPAGGNMVADKAVSSNIYPGPGENYRYNYIYAGDDFTLFDSEVEVYRKINPDFSKEFAGLFSDKKIGFFDMKKFNNITLNNISINEERDFGYSIYLGLKDGSFSIYKNWEKWPNAEKLCGVYNYECIENYRLGVDEILEDSDIVSIANKFLDDYSISLKNYGEPEVQKYWLREYLLSSDKSSFYIPDVISVVYPLKIDGKVVYEEYGQNSGLMVEVDMREKKVSGVYNLAYQYYESSSYSTERDKDVILDMVKQGGRYPDYYYFNEGETNTIDVKLGTPSLGMMKVWNYDEKEMKGYEAFVPAYIFPVLSESLPSYFYRRNIVVPAVKDFFVNGKEAVPLPAIMDEGNSSLGISGSGEASVRPTEIIEIQPRAY